MRLTVIDELARRGVRTIRCGIVHGAHVSAGTPAVLADCGRADPGAADHDNWRGLDNASRIALSLRFRRSSPNDAPAATRSAHALDMQRSSESWTSGRER